MAAIRIHRHDAEALAKLAEAAFPQEACALLVGRRAAEAIIIERIAPMRNIAANPEHAFEIDPAGQIALRRELREAGGAEKLMGPKIIGHWHSHPNGLAEPSATDATMAFEPEFIWLIGALNAEGRTVSLKAFRPEGNPSSSPTCTLSGFEPLPLVITEEAV